MDTVRGAMRAGNLGHVTRMGNKLVAVVAGAAEADGREVQLLPAFDRTVQCDPSLLTPALPLTHSPAYFPPSTQDYTNQGCPLRNHPRKAGEGGGPSLVAESIMNRFKPLLRVPTCDTTRRGRERGGHDGHGVGGAGH